MTPLRSGAALAEYGGAKWGATVADVGRVEPLNRSILFSSFMKRQ